MMVLGRYTRDRDVFSVSELQLPTVGIAEDWEQLGVPHCLHSPSLQSLLRYYNERGQISPYIDLGFTVSHAGTEAGF